MVNPNFPYLTCDSEDNWHSFATLADAELFAHEESITYRTTVRIYRNNGAFRNPDQLARIALY